VILESDRKIKLDEKRKQLLRVKPIEQLQQMMQQQQHEPSKNNVAIADTNNANNNDSHKDLKNLSIVLPCGFEHEYFYPTIQSIYETTPSHVLHEIVVVDDASDPPLQPIFEEKPHKYKDLVDKVKFVRLDSAVGLIGAKHAGAEASSGDILVFFDCHVKPAENYWAPYLDLISENYRRVIVPTITALNTDTWTEFNRPAPGTAGLSKCYLTFDGEFKWTTDSTDHVPIMSGGLLIMSRQWFFEVGGYDTAMMGWGGENLDQSLRIWRCGGEIVSASESYVAHMWRDNKHPAKYKLAAGSSQRNRARAMKIHTGSWFEKTLTFPQFQYFNDKSVHGQMLDVSSVQQELEGLNCKSFEWYLDRFSYIYRDGGVIPHEVFQLEAILGLASSNSPLCLTLSRHHQWNNAGEPNDDLQLSTCNEETSGPTVRNGSGWWHVSNRKDDGKCCSTFRVWNTDQCLGSGLKSFVCTLDQGQRAGLTKEGQLRVDNRCITIKSESTLELELTDDCSGATKWKKRGVFEPIEFNLLGEDTKRRWKDEQFEAELVS